MLQSTLRSVNDVLCLSRWVKMCNIYIGINTIYFIEVELYLIYDPLPKTSCINCGFSSTKFQNVVEKNVESTERLSFWEPSHFRVQSRRSNSVSFCVTIGEIFFPWVRKVDIIDNSNGNKQRVEQATTDMFCDQMLSMNDAVNSENFEQNLFQLRNETTMSTNHSRRPICGTSNCNTHGNSLPGFVNLKRKFRCFKYSGPRLISYLSCISALWHYPGYSIIRENLFPNLGISLKYGFLKKLSQYLRLHISLSNSKLPFVSF